MVIDAKYKKYWKDTIDHDDVRQVSGYARLKKVYDKLYSDEKYNKVIDCLIIYPDQNNGVVNFKGVDFKEPTKLVKNYFGVYKVGVKLPEVQSK